MVFIIFCMLSSVCLTELILNNVFKQTFAGFSNGTKAKVYWLFVIVIFILESYIVPLPKG